MPLYETKIVTVAARQFVWESWDKNNWQELAEWCGGNAHRPAEMDSDGWCSGEPVIDIPVKSVSLGRSEPSLRVKVGDYVVKTSSGEVQVHSKKDFEQMFVFSSERED